MTEFQAELLGTFILILLGNGVVANVVLKGTKGNSGGWIVITAGWALAVFSGVIIAGPYSGAHLNPAVTFALALAGDFPWTAVPKFMLAQVLGALLGALAVYGFYFHHYALESDADAKMATFCTAPAYRSIPNNIFSELIGTFVLIFAILHFTEPEISMGLSQTTKVGMGSLGAVPVMFVVLAIGLSLGGTTGYAINPARDLGPRLAHQLLAIPGKRDSDWSYAWVPVAGPIIGAGLAVLLNLWF
jgi:glycerol uptake facilitator protein